MARLLGGVAKISAALVLAASGFTAGCGGDDSGAEGLASLTPPDVPFYAEGVIQPEGDAAAGVEAFAERIGGISDPGQAVIAEVDRSLAENGLDVSYGEDIEPWLGDRLGIFVSSLEGATSGQTTPDFAAMAEIDDEDGANAFLDKIYAADPPSEEQQTSYEGTDYTVLLPGIGVGVIDDSAIVFGSETGIKLAIDAANGESLAESEEYTDGEDGLPDDPLASLWVEPAAVIEASIASGDIGPVEAQALEPLLGGLLSESVAATLTATADSATIDVSTMVDDESTESTESSLLTELPGESWLATAFPDLGPMLERALDQLASSGLPGAGEIERQLAQTTGLDLGEDVFSWLGDAAAFVEGTAAPGFTAGLIAETSDPEAPRALLDAVQKLAEQDSGLTSSGPPEGAQYGFTIGVPGIGGGAEAGVIGDELIAVLGATADEALNPAETLGDNPEFQAAIASLGDELSPALYMSLPELFQVAEMGSDGDIDYDQLRPYVDDLASLVAGTSFDDGHALSRMVVSLTDG